MNVLYSARFNVDFSHYFGKSRPEQLSLWYLFDTPDPEMEDNLMTMVSTMKPGMRKCDFIRDVNILMPSYLGRRNDHLLVPQVYREKQLSSIDGTVISEKEYFRLWRLPDLSIESSDAPLNYVRHPNARLYVKSVYRSIFCN